MREAFRPRHRPATLWAALALCAGIARAGDAPPDPNAATAKLRAAFPAPDPKYAFSFDGELSVGGAVLGTQHLAAEVDSYDGKPAWKLTEGMQATPVPMKQHLRMTAWVAPDLRLLKEEITDEKGTRAPEASVVLRTETGLVRRAADPGAGAATPVEGSDDTTTGTTAGLLLFLRMCPAEPARYSMTYLKEGYRRARVVDVEVKGASKMPPGLPPGDTWFATWKAGDETTEAFLDPATRSLAILRMTSSGFTGVLAAKGAIPPVPPMDFSKPPATAKEAVARFFVGCTSKDSDLVAGVVHWPSLHADALHSGFAGDEASFKKTTLEKLLARGDPSMRAFIEAQVRASMLLATETPGTDGRVVVAPGPPLKASMPGMAAKEIDGVWLVVGIVGR